MTSAARIRSILSSSISGATKTENVSITQSVLPKPRIARLHASKDSGGKNWPGCATRAGTSGYERSRLRAMKNTFAGRSPNRRIK
jgi:hypothetical protein